MKRQIALGLALVLVVASAATEAQVGGFLKKKAGEVLGGKPKPAPAPQAAPTPDPDADAAPAPAPATTSKTTPAATPNAEKAAVSPLEESALPLRQSADLILRGRGNERPNGDWGQLPFIPPAAVADAYGLGESAQVALVETVGTALKTLVMSTAFVSEHNTYIKSEHQAVDHGLKNIVTMEDAVKKNDLKTTEAIQMREAVPMGVDQVRSLPADYAKMLFEQELAEWTEQAAKPALSDRAKYQKLVAKAAPLEGLAGGDEKFLRGYAVLKSIYNDGPDSEDAVFAIHQRVVQEREQAAYDTHNLKAQLRQQLTMFVAVAAKVNFDAPTVEKNGKTLFTNAADERQGALWKACFRAGAAPTAAAVKLAKAWLAEM